MRGNFGALALFSVLQLQNMKNSTTDLQKNLKDPKWTFSYNIRANGDAIYAKSAIMLVYLTLTGLL
jgi:hypothetical protein